MALKAMANCKNTPVVYDVTRQADDIYHLRLHGWQRTAVKITCPRK